MKNKEIQEQRIRDYFIQATKELLMAEGMKLVSVRNISDKAGYSYATLYNYFKDVKQLVFHCISIFQEDCLTFIEEKTINSNTGRNRIAEKMKAYISFFLEYPNLFDLFYLEKTSEVSNNKEATDAVIHFLGNLCSDDWKFIEQHENTNKEDLKIKQHQLEYMVQGMLLTYLNRKQPDSYNDFKTLSNHCIDEMIQSKKKG